MENRCLRKINESRNIIKRGNIVLECKNKMSLSWIHSQECVQRNRNTKQKSGTFALPTKSISKKWRTEILTLIERLEVLAPPFKIIHLFIPYTLVILHMFLYISYLSMFAAIGLSKFYVRITKEGNNWLSRIRHLSCFG